jgi:hypothetical protein
VDERRAKTEEYTAGSRRTFLRRAQRWCRMGRRAQDRDELTDG